MEALVERSPQVCVSISHTTRAMRSGEQDGVSYHFVTEAAFLEMLSRSAFLEHAQVFENYYGTSQDWVDGQLQQGRDVILEIDWQGAEQIKRQRPESVAVFILPPSREALLLRLTARGQDDKQIIERRMSEAVDELSHYLQSEYIVVNDDFDQALDELQCIVESQRLRTETQAERYQSLLMELLS